MKIVTVDDYNRVRLPDVKPRQKFSGETGNNRIVLALVDEVDVPVVRARKINGKWIGAGIKVDRQAIVDAIREDRESR
ncbi:MAG TPA: hypothetical protein VGY56_11610 [Verrucomicrobiae bacterium]|nr:hypothetical protein [Verrucomicrobiae bacterium]